MFIGKRDSINFGRRVGSKDKKKRTRSIGQKIGAGTYKASAAAIGLADKVKDKAGSALYKASSLAIRGGGAVLDRTSKTRKELSKGFGEGFNKELNKRKR